MNITLWKAVKGHGVSVNLNGFEPKEGYAFFLKGLCAHWGALVAWHQGFESGIGNITYHGKEIVVFWTDFPFALSFDCLDEAMAKDLQKELENYFDLDKERWATAWKNY